MLVESWRDAVSRSWETIMEGGKAVPYRTPNKWAVRFEIEPSLNIHIQMSVSVVLIKGNSTSTSETNG